MKCLLLILLSLILCPANAYSSISQLKYYFDSQGSISDSQLRKLAIEKGVIPKDADRAFLDKAIRQDNTIITWIMIQREDKISLIESIKSELKEENTVIAFPATYYVDEINRALYQGILNGGITTRTEKDVVGQIFKTIAVMEGDYDDGRDKIELLKEELGEELFEKYKKIFPEKYKKLLKMRKEKRFKKRKEAVNP